MKTDSPLPIPVRRAEKLYLISLTKLRNRFSTASAVDPSGAVDVSLTSYGQRLAIVGYTIESIAAGRVKPRRLVLWVSDEDFTPENYPMLERLERRGVEILRTPDYGPHKKNYSYASREFDGTTALVTADDDFFYPAGWLQGLVAEHKRHPEDFIGYRAHRMTVDDEGHLTPYASWPPATAADPADSFNLITGGAGAVYPPALLEALREEGESFMESVPRADDLWVNMVAQRRGINRRVADPAGQYLVTYPRSQAGGLFNTNVDGGGNDAQLAAIVTPADEAHWRQKLKR